MTEPAYDLLIRGGRVATVSDVFDADVAISGETIVAIGRGLSGARREIDARLAALVKEAIDEGSLRSDVPPALVSRLLFGMVNSLVEWHRAGGGVEGAQLSEAITTIAFDGLALGPPHQS